MKNCIVCGREIYRRHELSMRKNNRKARVKRNPKAVTCSKPCSRTYGHVSRYIRSINKAKEKQYEREYGK